MMIDASHNYPHIAQGGKRQRHLSPTAWPLPVSMPDGWKLLPMQRASSTAGTPVLLPAAPRTPPSAYRKYSRHPFPSPIAQENGLISESDREADSEMVSSVEYCSSSATIFKREESDDYGTLTMAWF